MKNSRPYSRPCGASGLIHRPAVTGKTENVQSSEMEQRILLLEEENGNLQQLVCYLLAKNETMRGILCPESA
jgi:hypothetical protein